MSTQFQPTQAQLTTAQDLFIAMAFEQVIKPQFENIQRQVLEDGNYRNAYFNHTRERMRTEDNTEFIRNPRYDYCIEDTDAGRYFSELDRRTRNAGFNNGMNALSIAENNVRLAQDALITAFAPITNLTCEDVCVSLEIRKQLIELNLKFMAQHMDTTSDECKRKMAKYYREHVNHIKPIVNEFLSSLNPPVQ